MSLTACGATTRQIVKTEYIPATVPDLPAVPTYWPVQWHGEAGGNYCLDEANGKNLLKNVEIMKAYGNEMRQILSDLKEKK